MMQTLIIHPDYKVECDGLLRGKVTVSVPLHRVLCELAMVSPVDNIRELPTDKLATLVYSTRSIKDAKTALRSLWRDMPQRVVPLKNELLIRPPRQNVWQLHGIVSNSLRTKEQIDANTTLFASLEATEVLQYGLDVLVREAEILKEGRFSRVASGNAELATTDKPWRRLADATTWLRVAEARMRRGEMTEATSALAMYAAQVSPTNSSVAAEPGFPYLLSYRKVLDAWNFHYHGKTREALNIAEGLVEIVDLAPAMRATACIVAGYSHLRQARHAALGSKQRSNEFISAERYSREAVYLAFAISNFQLCSDSILLLLAVLAGRQFIGQYVKPGSLQGQQILDGLALLDHIHKCGEKVIRPTLAYEVTSAGIYAELFGDAEKGKEFALQAIGRIANDGRSPLDQELCRWANGESRFGRFDCARAYEELLRAICVQAKKNGRFRPDFDFRDEVLVISAKKLFDVVTTLWTNQPPHGLRWLERIRVWGNDALPMGSRARARKAGPRVG